MNNPYLIGLLGLQSKLMYIKHLKQGLAYSKLDASLLNFEGGRTWVLSLGGCAAPSGPTKNLPTLEAQPEILFQIMFYGDPSLFLKEECQIR